MESNNIVSLLRERAALNPRDYAVLFPEKTDSMGRVAYTHLTYAQLEDLSNYYAWGLQKLKISVGDKTLLMIKPSLDFYALLFALLKVGAVPVLIDPGMGGRGFLKCVKQVCPKVFIGIPKAHLLRLFCRSAFSSVTTLVTLGKRWFWGGKALYELDGKHETFPIYEPELEDLAAVLFTSGSTGPAKGVCYTHRIFKTQVQLVRRIYDIKPGEMDLACFPLFSLFSIISGAAAIIPDMDPTKPGSVDPKKIIEPIYSFPVTYSFGSPALWDRVSEYCVKNHVKLPGLTRIIMAGAPVAPCIHERLLNHILDEGSETYTPYGATESLPVANFSGHEVLAGTYKESALGHGTCVGKPIQEITAAVIAITDAPISNWRDAKLLEQGEIGELCVKGECVTREYFHRPDATALAKIKDGDSFWHRIGDVGYIDTEGRFWFCGRKAHRVVTEKGTLYSVPCEAIFNKIAGVRRSALVGLGARPKQIPAIVLELDDTKTIDAEVVLEAVKGNKLVADIKRVFFYPAFPVDVRHNAKINREKLAVWANNQAGNSV